MNNGRVNIMGPNNADRFLLYERVAPKKSTNTNVAFINDRYYISVSIPIENQYIM